MTLKLPELDDRKFEDLVQEALRLIPSYAPEWTNHNPSDPGITLVELFAYYTELLIYRLNLISESNKKSFLKLLGCNELSDNKSMDEEIRDVLIELRKPNRAVTLEDYKKLAFEVEGVARVHCISNINLGFGRDMENPGHVSLIIVPTSDNDNFGEENIDDLLRNVENELEKRRLLTTRVHAFRPSYLTVGIRLAVTLKPGAMEHKFLFKAGEEQHEEYIDSFGEEYIDSFGEECIDSFGDKRIMLIEAYENAIGNKDLISDNIVFSELQENTMWLVIDIDNRKAYIIAKKGDIYYLYEDVVRTPIMRALWDFVHPLTGGSSKDGWPFGRNIFISELYQIVDSQDAIDYVTKMKDPEIPDGEFDEVFVIEGSYTDRKLLNYKKDLYALEVEPRELVKIPFDQIQIEVKRGGGD